MSDAEFVQTMAAGDVTWLPIQDAPPSAVRVEVKA